MAIDDCRLISVVGWRRRGYFTPGARIVLSWRTGGEATIDVFPIGPGGHLSIGYEPPSGEPDEVFVGLVGLGQRLGGWRYWLLCPWCGGRTDRLRLRDEEPAGWWRCRRCLGGRYKSQGQGSLERALRAVERAGSRLGGEGLSGALPVRPKGLHRRSWLARLDAAWEAQEKLLAALEGGRVR